MVTVSVIVFVPVVLAVEYSDCSVSGKAVSTATNAVASVPPLANPVANDRQRTSTILKINCAFHLPIPSTSRKYPLMMWFQPFNWSGDPTCALLGSPGKTGDRSDYLYGRTSRKD